MLIKGERGEAGITVQAGDTARALALTSQDEFPEVFATSRMIALMEVAAARAMQRLLQPGQLSVGVGIDIVHSSPTAVGSEVYAVARFLAAEGKLLRFRIEAFDEAGLIGEGEHTRAIIDTERLIGGALRRRQWSDADAQTTGYGAARGGQ